VAVGNTEEETVAETEGDLTVEAKVATIEAAASTEAAVGA